MKKSFTKSDIWLSPCVLNKKDLMNLDEIIKEGMDIHDSYNYSNISAMIDGGEVSENTLEKFLQIPNLPNKIYVFTISYSIGEKRIYLSFDESSLYLNITGESKSWVNGKYQEIKEFLSNRRPFYWFIIRFNYIPYMMLFYLGMITSLFFIINNWHFVRNNVYTIGICFFIYMLLSIFLLWKKTSFFPYSTILLKDKKEINFDTLILIFTLIVNTIFSILLLLKK